MTKPIQAHNAAGLSGAAGVISEHPFRTIHVTRKNGPYFDP